MKEHRWVILALLLLLLATDASAAMDTNNVLNTIADEYKAKAASWSATLQTYAMRLFWLLALVDFAVMGITAALRRADWTDLAAEVVRKVLFLGFFLVLLTYGQSWAKSIVNSMWLASQSANTAAGAPPDVSPSYIFDAGLELAGKVIDAMSFTSPIDSLGMFIGAFIIMVCFALLAAFLLVAIIEAYIVLNAGVILLGFGGSVFTKDYTLAFFRYALAVGAKLLVLLLLLGIGQTFIQDWVNDFEADKAQITVLIGSAIVLLALVKSIPDILQGLLQGVSFGSGQSLLQAAQTAGGAAAGAGMAAAGAGMAVKEAAKLASTQGAGASGGVAGAAGMAAATMGNLARAAGVDIGGRMTGDWSTQYGTMGGRMAANMRDKRMQAGMSTPAAAPPPFQGKADSGGTIQPAERTRYQSPAKQLKD